MHSPPQRTLSWCVVWLGTELLRTRGGGDPARGTRSPAGLARQPRTLPFCLARLGVTSLIPVYTNTVLPAFVSCDSLAKASYGRTKALTSPFLTMDFMQAQPSGPEKPFPTPSRVQPFLKPLGFQKDWGPPTQLAASTHTERPFPPALPLTRPLPAKPQQALGPLHRSRWGSVCCHRGCHRGGKEQAWSHVARAACGPALPAAGSAAFGELFQSCLGFLSVRDALPRSQG